MEAAHSFHMSEQVHKALHIFNYVSVNLKTYMTTVAAFSQIPVSEAENAVLVGPP